MWLIVDRGQHLIPQNESKNEFKVGEYKEIAKPVVADHQEGLIQQVALNFKNPISLLVLQISVIVLFSRLFGIIFSRFGQPLVMGEIIAGILLGPSMLGLLSPGLFNSLFPKEKLYFFNEVFATAIPKLYACLLNFL